MTTCIQCGATREKPAPPRLPRGWKRSGEDTWCADCWRSRCVLRAVTVPVASVIDGDWAELRAALREMWVATTQASNWMLTELYARDVRRTNEEKMPPMVRVYLYPEARARFPQLPPQVCSALEQTTQASYRAIRYKLIWTSEVSLPTFRYPTPYPVPSQSWSIGMENDSPVVDVRIAERRMRLRLRGGPRFRRQRVALEQMIAGEAKCGAMAIYASGSDIMCKIAAWLPRQQSTDERTGELMIRTDAESLIVASTPRNERLWVYHGDHIRRWSAEHQRRLQRWADDQKPEHRPRPPFAERREQAALKYRRRMSSACHQVAAMIAGFAQRRKFASVRYDDSVQEFCARFPWYRLRELIAEKLDAAGIQFEHAAPAEAAPAEAGQPDVSAIGS